MPEPLAADELPWRCFVAVPIPEELRARLDSHVAELRRTPGADADWRWTDPGSWHMTLAFLGPTDPADIPAITDALSAISADAAPFAAAGSGLGAFPRPNRARVLWYGIGDSEGRLAGLARAVQAACGLDVPPRFQGHLTLARSRDRNGIEAAGVLSAAPAPRGDVPVDRLVLYRSHLSRGPARYEEISTVLLSGAAK